MKFDEEASNHFGSLVGKKYKRGDLLSFKKGYILTDFQRNYRSLKSFRDGYPVPLSDIKILDEIDGKPFMFLDWAAYGKEWLCRDHRGRPSSTQPLKLITYNGSFVFGMNIFFSNKLMFLTCDYPYSNYKTKKSILLLDSTLCNIKKIS